MKERALWTAFLGLVLAAAALSARLSPPSPGSRLDARVSTENRGPRGSRALYLWLEEFGHPTRSLRRPLSSIGPELSCLFVLEPTQEIAPLEAEALFAWVEDGGTLFLAPGVAPHVEAHLERWVSLDFDPTAAAQVRGDRVVPDGGERWRYRRVRPGDRGMFSYPVSEVAILGDARVSDPSGEHTLLFPRDGQGLLAEIFVGEGVLVLFPEADLLTNQGLQKASNVELLASLAADWIEPGTEVWFDEYDHGARVAGSLFFYFGRRRPGLFAVALLAVSVLAVVRYGRALTTRPEPERVRRRHPTEFVEALGSLYARSKAVAPAWSALARTGQQLVSGGRTGVAALLAGLPPEDRRSRIDRLAIELAPPPGGKQTEGDLIKLATAIAHAVKDRE